MEKSISFIADVAVEQYKACSQDCDKLEWDCSRVKHVQFLKTWEELQTRFLTFKLVSKKTEQGSHFPLLLHLKSLQQIQVQADTGWTSYRFLHLKVTLPAGDLSGKGLLHP